nr:unnamed protein product [Digitaria exilis]
MPAPGSAAPGDNETRSASAIVGDNLTGHHLLHIDGYSRTKDKLPTGKSIKSCPFRAGGHRWRINYYPNGQTSNCADFISVFLHLEQSAGEPVVAWAKFGLLDRAGKPVPSNTLSTSLKEFAPDGTGTGSARRAGLPLSRVFRLQCHNLIWTSTSAILLMGKEGADVTFQVAGEAFRAHRFLLAVRWCVFKAELCGSMKESTTTGNCIRIDDMLPQVFKALLHFIYTDSLPQMDEQEDAVMAQHLLEAADRFH